MAAQVQVAVAVAAVAEREEEASTKITNFPLPPEDYDLKNKAEKGLLNIEYRPTVCQRCLKLLYNTYVEKDVMQPEPSLYIFCPKCFESIVPTGTYVGPVIPETEKADSDSGH